MIGYILPPTTAMIGYATVFPVLRWCSNGSKFVADYQHVSHFSVTAAHNGYASTDNTKNRFIRDGTIFVSEADAPHVFALHNVWS